MATVSAQIRLDPEVKARSMAHQQRQTGLSTVGAVHSLAVDRFGWIC